MHEVDVGLVFAGRTVRTPPMWATERDRASPLSLISSTMCTLTPPLRDRTTSLTGLYHDRYVTSCPSRREPLRNTIDHHKTLPYHTMIRAAV